MPVDPSSLRKIGLKSDACEEMVTLTIKNNKLQNTIEALVNYLGSTMAQVNELEKKVGKLERQKQGPELPKDLPQKLEKIEQAIAIMDPVMESMQETVSQHTETLQENQNIVSTVSNKLERHETAPQ